MNQPASTKTSSPAAPHGASEAAESAKANPVRLAILLGIMVVSIGALGIGKFVFDPDVKARSEALEKEADKLNSGALVKESEPGKVIEGEKRDRNIYLSANDVQKVLGRGPTKRVVVKNEAGKDHFLKEYYCWWGPLPIPSCYITVIYSDPEGARYKTHYPNGEPEEADLPPDEAKLKRQAEQANKENANAPQIKVPDLSGNGPAQPLEPPGTSDSADKKEEKPSSEKEEASDKKDTSEKKEEAPAKSDEPAKKDEDSDSEKKADDSN